MSDINASGCKCQCYGPTLNWIFFRDFRKNRLTTSEKEENNSEKKPPKTQKEELFFSIKKSTMMQFWLFSYNPCPMTQGLGNCVLMISSPLNSHSSNSFSVQPVFPVSVSPSLCSNRGIHPLTGPRSAWAESGMGNISVGTLRLKGERKSGQEEMVTLRSWALGGSGSPTASDRAEELSCTHLVLQASRCGGMARVSQSGCGDTCRAGVRPGDAAEVQLVQPQHPAVMGTVPCEQTEWENGKCSRTKEFSSS